MELKLNPTEFMRSPAAPEFLQPQDSILGSIGIWTGFDFAEEREKVRGTIDGELKHDHSEDNSEMDTAV